MEKFSPTRSVLLLGLIAASLAGMSIRVAYLQTYGRERTIRSAERQQHREDRLQARRGSVLDCNGHLMAASIQTHTLFVDAKFFREESLAQGKNQSQMDASLRKLAALADLAPDQLVNLIAQKPDERYLRVAENLEDATCEAITKLDLPGVGLEPTQKRYYPMGSLAAHVLGTVRKDGVGLEGVEVQFDRQLAGHDGRKVSLKDARRHDIGVAAEDYALPQHGQHLVLTLDANIQMIAEQELSAACAEFKAKRGEAIIMDPNTGDVLALANWPTFNPQNLEDSTPEVRCNRALVYPMEPGSVIKPFIAGPALAWKITRPEELWPIPGITYRTPYGRLITDVHGYGKLSTWDVLVKSSNIGMSLMGERMGNPRLFQALTSFGFGKPTGIELPGEDPGRVNPLRRWNKFSTESVAQGYEVMVTPLQLARAFCAYANGGRLVTPRLVKGVVDAEGSVIARTSGRAELVPQAIDRSAAADMRRILCDVVVRGTATKARSRYWNLFGKTGTAHISDGPGRGYSETKYNSSFMGGAPYENPRLVVLISIHEVQKNGKNYYGGTVSGPPAARILERSLAYLQVPQSPDLPLPPAQVAGVLFNYDPHKYQRPADPTPTTTPRRNTTASTHE